MCKLIGHVVLGRRASIPGVLLLLTFALIFSSRGWASCAIPGNAIEAENCLTGTPQSTWDISGAGDSSIQGFATDISVNKGSTVTFKIKSAAAYRLDLYRMGYYGGNGARKVTTVPSSGTLPAQAQPACRTDSTGLYDCGNWAVSASWAVPSTAVSGIYFARLVRPDTQGASHVFFIVRDDTGASDIVFKTSDTTWQAYNDEGGANLYTGGPGPKGGAYKVSYNRPFHTRVYEFWSWVFNAEYPMVRFLEANGYDVSYFTSVDADRFGPSILQHKMLLSVGHDEYWSGDERANVEAARAAGVHLAFITGNGIFWKTRWENSIDGTNTPYRTMVCYKETHSNAKTDPLDPPLWTGTWRDPRFSPPADGGRPENALAGTIFMVNGPGPAMEMKVPQADGQMRFWRNTAPARLGSGQTYTTSINALGYEWDIDADNGSRPAGQFDLSTASYSISGNYLLDYGSNYGSGTAVHHLTMYRYVSGNKSALVFGSGTSQWPWGLDGNHDGGSTTPDANLKQATVNLLADMGIQPVTLQGGLVAATASTDTAPPTSIITSPASGASIPSGTNAAIQGTAADTGGGVVGGVEVSTDNGVTWHPANGRGSWSYTWTATGSSATIRSRAVDDSGNLESPSAGVSVTITGSGSGSSCPGGCTTIWPSTTDPVISDQGPDNSVELGVRFQADGSGTITGIRFYKSSLNTGTHVGSLWSNSGTLLATATFTGESASGWQQANFATPVAITANTVYVASYHTNVGHYSDDNLYFSSRGFDSPPLHALQDGVAGINGVYSYGSGSVFPTQAYISSNYWVDVVFNPAGPAPNLTAIAVTPVNPAIVTGATQQFTATGTYSDNSTQNLTSSATWASSSASVATINAAGLATGVGVGTTTISASSGGVASGSNSATLTVNAAPLTITTTSLPNGTLNVAYPATALAATGGTPPYTWSIASGLPAGLTLNTATGAISGTPTAAGTFNFTVQVADSGGSTPVTKALSITIAAAPTSVSIWPDLTVPGVVDGGPDSSVELGVKFRSDVAGTITGIRFYKASTNTGTHVGNLWSSAGALQATATFTGETDSGWQQVDFTTPVAIAANTVYVASYHANNGHYSDDQNYFASAGVDNAPLHALANGVSGGNGVYAYGSTSAFPNQTWNSTNYWVDVVFTPAGAAPLAISTASPLPGGTVNAAYSATLAATGGTPPYTWSIASGLPAGLTLNTATGAISGTPTATGTFNFTAQVTDSGGGTASKNLSIVVANPFLAPNANQAVTTNAGDNNGFQTTPANAYSADGLFAVDANSGTNTNTSCTNTGKDKHNYYNFAFNLAGATSIQGIEVQLTGKVSSTTNAPFMCVQLSWDGGTTWTTTQSTPTLSTTNATYTLGGPANTWGRTWAAGDFTPANFRVRIIDVAASTARTFSLDGVGVRVTYQQ